MPPGSCGDFASGGFTRAFTAVEIPDSVKDSFPRIDMRGLARAIGSAQLHITLNFLGYIAEAKLESLVHIIEGYKHSAFDISFDGVGMFESRGRGVVFIDIHDGAYELAEMHAQLDGLFVAIGIPKEGRKFTPHAAFARFKDLDRNRIGELRGAVGGFKGQAFGRFRCKGIVLKKSVLSSSGPAYSTLASSDFIS